MKYKYVIFLLLSILLCSSFSLPTVFAESEIISIKIDNQRKIAYPNQLVQFTMEVTNNSSSKENFIIRHAWENSILWFPMNIEMGDDDQKVYDSSPFGNYGTLHNFSGDYGLAHTDKLDHEAILFDGDDDYVEVPYSSSLDVSMVTLACWVKISENQEDWQTIVCSNRATEHYEMQIPILGGLARAHTEIRYVFAVKEKPHLFQFRAARMGNDCDGCAIIAAPVVF